MRISLTILAEVNCHIQNRPLDTTHELALGVWGLLKMETSQGALCRFALVVLDKGYPPDLGFEVSLGKAFEGVAAAVLK